MSPVECDPQDPSRPFKSRPDIVVPQLSVTLNNVDLLSPGFYFLAQFKSYVSTPMLFDNRGDLIWVGSDAYAGTEGPGPHVYDFHTCDYQNSKHLCLLRGFNDQGHVRGQGIILDSHYQPVQHVSGAGVATSCDLHEFTTAESGTTSIITQYRRRLYDATSIKGHGMVWVLEGVFQEIDLESGRVLFEWKSLDHVDPIESQVSLTQGTRLAPWDYFHLNSVEKMPDGNYLVSARHLSTIFKISASDGSVLWRLGGDKSSFRQMDSAFLFQHHARVLEDGEKITRLSLFDNARRPAFEPERASSGIIIQLDHQLKTVQVEKRYTGPDIEYTAKIAGSTIVLPNKNVLVGFGDAGCFTEYTSDGIPGFKACVRDQSRATLYRVAKDTWIGEPLNEVALVSFSRTNSSSTAFYTSWNGATEVKRWRVYGAMDQDDAFQKVSDAPKSGFETTMTTANHYARAYVEALSATGKVIGKSGVVTTFVPAGVASGGCDDLWCPEPLRCTISNVADTGPPHKSPRILGTLPRNAFAQALIFNLLLTVTLILCLKYARHKSRFARRIHRLLI